MLIFRENDFFDETREKPRLCFLSENPREGIRIWEGFEIYWLSYILGHFVQIQFGHLII